MTNELLILYIVVWLNFFLSRVTN